MVPKDPQADKANGEEFDPATDPRVQDLERGMRNVDPVTGEIVKASKQPFSDEELRNLNSLDSVKALLGDKVATASDLGSGFAVLDTDQKRRLVGVPLLFLFWQFNNGKQGDFVSAHVVQYDPRGQIVGKFVINDGSTGIMEQLREFTNRTGQSQGMFAERGLRASDYTYTDDDGIDKPATTFYIDTSPAA